MIAGEGARAIALPLGDELVVDGLDCEQVWTQVDAQHGAGVGGVVSARCGRWAGKAQRGGESRRR